MRARFGTAYAPCVLAMRPLAILLLASACVGGSMRPAVIPKLSEMPADPGKRDAVLDSATTTPGPEQRRGQTTKQKRAETAAATAAAWIGLVFSSSENVTLGGASTFDENLLFEDRAPRRDEEKKGEAPAPAPVDPMKLVPWVRVTNRPSP